MIKHLQDSPYTGINTTDLATKALVERAEKLFEDKDNEAAFALLNQALADRPDHPDLLYHIAKFTFEHKAPLEGIVKLNQLLERHPDHLDALLKLGDIYLRPGDTRRATPFFRKALEIAPQNPGVHLGMAALNQRKGDLPLAIEGYRKAIELQLKFPITKEEPKKKADFRITDAEKLLWSTCALMAEHGVHMFPAFGTMLGLVRDGGLFIHDKDIDTGLPQTEMARAVRIMEHNGWSEVQNSFGYSNPKAMYNAKAGISMDISGFVIDEHSKKALTAGAWMPGVPKEWNLIFEFDEIALEKRPTPDGTAEVWFLENPETWLTAIYGPNWETPDKNFDTMVRARNVRSFSPLLQCFTYSRIFSNWTENNVPRALALTRTALEHEPHDGLMKRVLSRLEARRKSGN